jgi:hypothetical protein
MNCRINNIMLESVRADLKSAVGGIQNSQPSEQDKTQKQTEEVQKTSIKNLFIAVTWLEGLVRVTLGSEIDTHSWAASNIPLQMHILSNAICTTSLDILGTDRAIKFCQPVILAECKL